VATSHLYPLGTPDCMTRPDQDASGPAPGLRHLGHGYERAMAPDAHTDERDPARTPGASEVVPSGTNAVVIYSDLRCPWAFIAIRRLLDAVDRKGVDSELSIDHRWFPLDDEAIPADPDALDRELEPLRGLAVDVGWHRWAGSDDRFPVSSELAAAWVQGAKRDSPGASVHLDLALRQALFTDGRDIGSEAVIEEVAGSISGLDVDTVRAEVASGRATAELERHAELATSELVPASPTIVLTDGASWTNPGIEFHADDGVPVIDADDPAVYDRTVDAYLALRHYD
jgi:predicted DsbA family dithiol-disulfide isomerase